MLNIFFLKTGPLAIPAPCISESYIKRKINLSFYFHTSLWCLKVLWRPLRPFEAPEISVKIKIEVNFLSSPGSEREGLTSYCYIYKDSGFGTFLLAYLKIHTFYNFKCNYLIHKITITQKINKNKLDLLDLQSIWHDIFT